MNPQLISQFLHSRGGMAAMWALAFVAAIVAMESGEIHPLEGYGGLALPSANNWIAPGWASWAMGIVANAAIALMAVGINRQYNVLRSLTMLFGGLYAIMMAATPSLFGQFYGGTLTCIALLGAQYLLYSTYAKPSLTRRTFLVFFLMALTALVSRPALFFIPVLLLGTVQMRVFSLRTFLAAAIGVLTPAWILVGMGLIPVDSFHWPHLTNVLPHIEGHAMWAMASTIGLTIVLGIFFTAANAVKTLSYNSRQRSYNGFISITLIVTMILTIVDWEDWLIYVPILNLLVSVEIAHFFVNHRGRLSFVPIVLIVATYAMLYLWAVWN